MIANSPNDDTPSETPSPPPTPPLAAEPMIQPVALSREERRATLRVLTKHVGLSRKLAREVIQRLSAPAHLDVDDEDADSSIHSSLLDMPATGGAEGQSDEIIEDAFAPAVRPTFDFLMSSNRTAASNPSRPTRKSWSRLFSIRPKKFWTRRRPLVEEGIAPGRAEKIATAVDKQPLYVSGSNTTHQAVNTADENDPRRVMIITISSSTLDEVEPADPVGVSGDETPRTRFCCF
ncbi:hypothetical protein HYDPIDRAFT_38906 [Hydnomerulius pinastri MD-312]|nr:hypothetical protein HYDPIDRAFT_38906 [Hydnomerulius pinastri MD-312]